MRTLITGRPVCAEISRIKTAVSAGENRLKRKLRLENDPLCEGSLLFDTNAPNDGIYLASDINGLSDMCLAVDLAELNPLFNSSGLILGSGLGATAFTLKMFLKNVTAWEYDNRLLSRSKTIAKKLGDPYDKIRFRLGDFLEQATLSDHSLIYFFWPFFENFETKMGDLLFGADKGTFVVSQPLDAEDRPIIFPKGVFERAALPPEKTLGHEIFIRI